MNLELQEAGQGGRLSDQVVQGVTIEYCEERGSRFIQHAFETTGGKDSASATQPVLAVDYGLRFFPEPDDVAQPDFFRRQSQREAAADPAPRREITVSPKIMHNLDEVIARDAER